MINVYSRNETNFNNNGLATLTPDSCDFEININETWQLTLVQTKDKDGKYKHLVADAFLRLTGADIVREWNSDYQLLRIYDVKNSLFSVTVIAFPVALEAVYDAPIQELVIEDKTGAQTAEALEDYIAEENDKYSISSNVTATRSARYENTNLIEVLNGSNDDSFVQKWGGEIAYDNYNIIIRNKLGDQSQSRAYPIRYGRNLAGLEHELDMSTVVTRLYPISRDDMRLNGWQDVTSQGGNPYVDSPLSADYPLDRCMFVSVDYSLIDTDSKSVSQTAKQTAIWQQGMVNTARTVAQGLWNTILADLTNTYEPEYIKTLLTDIIKYTQDKVQFVHAGWQSMVKSVFNQGISWIKTEELDKWEWHQDKTVTPWGWWYGSSRENNRYAKNEYVKIGKTWEYFNDDGYWEDFKQAPSMDWMQDKTTGGWKYGYSEGYYAHNEYVYMTIEGTMKEWWYDAEGWYDDSKSGDSDMGWHGDSSSGIWFGESDATPDDTNKFLHDRWAWIDGTYYWFDEYGYTDADPAHSMPNYPWYVQEDTQGSWFGNDTDKMLGSKWLTSQWAKIDNEWWYFDSNGYRVDMDEKASDTIGWFGNAVYDGSIDYIKAKLTEAYTLLYSLMTAWCEKQYSELGIDKPTINISVDLIDLSKTTEYADYASLERIALGDKVLVIDKDGNEYEERVVGLTYDCIRKYNTKVEVGQLSKTISQSLNVSYSGASEGQKLIAGDNVVINGKVISVGDYVGRVVGLLDSRVNNHSIVSGNVANLGLQAGENITITRNGNTYTISGEAGGGGGLEYWQEDTDKIYRKVTETIQGWDCDDEYKHGQFQIVNPVSNWINKVNTNTACCAYYSFADNTLPMIISTNQSDATAHVVFNRDYVSSFTLNGVTLYYPLITYLGTTWGTCTINGDVPPYLGDFTEKYHELNDDATATQEYVRDLLIELSHFCTTKVKYSGIGGNNSDYVAWGGDYYSVGASNPAPSDMPFNVAKDGIVEAKDYRVDGVSIDKVRDVKVNGESVVTDKVAEISIDANKTHLGTTTPSANLGVNGDRYIRYRGALTTVYKYIKLSVSKNRSNAPYTQYAEIKFKDANGNYYPWGASTIASSHIPTSAGEDSSKLIDDNLGTKMCVQITPSDSNVLSVVITTENNIDLATYNTWEWYTANDEAGRDPVSFELAVSNDNQEWVVLDSVTDADITTNRQALAYSNEIELSTSITIIKEYSKIDGQWVEEPIEGGGGGSSSVDYSTVEQEIGTWIDGKPLYQITLNYPNLALNARSIQEYDLSDLNIETFMVDYGATFAYRNTGDAWDGQIWGATTNSDSQGFMVWYRDRTGDANLVIRTNNYAMDNFTITIRYTKTTD